MNFLDTIGEKILDCVRVALGRQLGYLIHYKSNVDNLKTQVEELRGARNRVQCDVDEAIDNVEKIYDDVQTWLIDSDEVMIKADEIFKDNGEANMKCCNGWCPNLKSRYQVSKRSHKKGLEVKEIKDKGKFDRVGYRESTQVGGTAISNRGYEAFESRRRILTDVQEALKNPNITRIGVYGMGGIGKTMLVKEVLKQAKRDKLFNKYLFEVVSNPPDLKKIQREIAEKLGLKLDMESESVLADRLYKRLLDEKILLVMDDIWKPIDLEALGISFGNDKKGSKLLLTSRFHNVVCNDMDTQKQFEVGVLSGDEARNLFEGIVGEFAKTPKMQPYMHQIVKECAGLPIAITTVANALKNQTNIYVWKDFLTQLKMSSLKEIEGMNEKVYRSIRLSYKFLKSEEAESLLLLCSLHEEDYNIEVEDLLRYCVGWGLFDNLDTIEGARCRVHTLVERLKNSSLLLDGDYNGTVKMHDVIRDVVINIAAEERHMYTIRTVNELKTRSKRKDTVAISLPYINGDVLELPNQFECSKLELLMLFNQRVDFRIPDSFFEGLKDLKVLKLSESWCGVLPSSLSALKNLQTLCLDGEVQNAIIIGELKNLKALSLSLSNTERLPKEIGQLTHLQLLDLRECSELKFIPPNVLSNLKRLEELYLPDDVEWEVEAQSTERIKAMVSELDHLSHLTKLHICIENAKILPNAMVFERLESYRIAIGSAWSWGETSETSQILKLNISFQSDGGYKVLFRKCETLILDRMNGVKNNLYELDSEGFQSLKHLTVQYNDEIQDICKSMGVLDSIFPRLESITLSKVNNLERICYMRLPTKTFCNLRVVTVSNCCKLESVFSSSMVGCFSHLQEMNIEDCEIMSAIVAIEREEEIEVNSEDSITFANLHSLKLKNLFKLKGFLSVVDSHVLFNGKVAFPNLEELEIKGMDSMEMIWSNQLISDCFGKLETMTVSGCTNLTNIVPPNMLRTLRNLKELYIFDCDSVEEIFEIQGTNNVEESRDIAAAELISSKLRDLEKVKHVWSMDPQKIITFAKLRTIEIDGCSCLKSVFPTSVAKALSQLEALEIKDCAMMEEIVAKEEGIETTTLFVFPKLTTLRLYNLPELKSLYPKSHISKWPSLESLNIHKCNKLKIFDSNEYRMQETNGLGDYASLFEQPLFFVEEVAFPNLEKLEIKGMDSMEMIWSNQLISDCFGKLEIITFAKLRTIEIDGCSCLKSVFPTSVAKALSQLEALEINDCAMMEEIVAKEEGIETTTLFVFLKLTTLRLYNLPELKSLYPKSHISKWPSLESLYIRKCNKLKIFDYSNECRMQETNGLGDYASLLEQPFFFVEEDKFPKLKTLSLDEGDVMNETCGGPSAEFCCNLKYMWLFGNGGKSTMFPNEEAPIARAGVSDFRRLKNIVPFSSTSFHYLERLEACGSDVLISLLTPSTARTLVQLKLIQIYGCKRMTEIVANEGSEAEAGDEIAFNNLRDLVLIDLLSLTAFHLGNRTIKFPSLVKVFVFKCPKLKIFCSGVLSTPKLEYIWIEGERIDIEEGDGEVGLNATIKEYWEAKLETCDQKFAEKTDASDGEKNEHETNDDLERETTSEVGDTQCDGE
ncbi:disease resistance protein At4g27190-like [Castanea sativa]|uniref:disease resistance protein At4g27190-like n=1 Tax=Castanea sativa TaxID=21020 RepID=UPI003F64B7D4